ncbi:sodium/nucleoside cotransporter [Plakobranchus ocellatus]|uniref:Sodium/nucleoside cotransporter n=1 Tax=Plakobranchus ocellatus TaxID=259542 RepID=A0AAV4E234_9GAST|nr:sodium/nucleoside cotransporter [Plakobranchus ocellatus]
MSEFRISIRAKTIFRFPFSVHTALNGSLGLLPGERKDGEGSNGKLSEGANVQFKIVTVPAFSAITLSGNMEPLDTSSPKKIPKCNDSGVGIQLTDLSGSSDCGSSETDHLNGKSDALIIDVSELEVDGRNDDYGTSSLIELVSRICGSNLQMVVVGFLSLLYAAYFVWAVALSAIGKCDEGHNVMPLVYLTIAAVGGIFLWYVTTRFDDELEEKVAKPFKNFMKAHWSVLKWLLSVVPFLGVLAIIIVSAFQRPSNLMSLVGWLSLVVFLFISSRAPKKINWRPVLGGFALQFYFATMILKWDKGYNLFDSIGKIFTKFLSYSNYGAEFVFGSTNEHFFAFKVLPVIIFFSCVITMLYYLGVMQAIIGKIAFVMRITLGTTAAESLCAAGNIFVGQTEAPILIRPFLPIMTRSELHAVMVGGFATIAGAVLAAYIMKGVSAIHLLTASVMNAPTALAVSKILYPELGCSKLAKMKETIKEKQPYNNVIEAAAAGASSAISLVANVGANLIAFVALLFFFNSVVAWFGTFVCHPELSFEMICSYLFMPLAYLMGVEWKDAGVVAELIGIKTFLNEFIAYDKLAGFITNRVKCQAGPVLSVRSEIIATYALCGFANLSSIGIQLGGLGPMAPNRLGDLAQLAITALMGGICTNLMTACVAGLLVVEMPFEAASCMNATNASMNTTLAIMNSTVFNSSAAI